MLRDMKSLPPPSLPRIARVFTLGTLATAGLLLAGVRGDLGPNRALAQATQAPAARPDPGTATAAYDLTYVPAATDLLLALRPTTLLAKPEFKRLVETLKQLVYDGPKVFDMPIEEMEQVLVVWLRPVNAPPPDGRAQPILTPSAVIFRSAQARDWKTLATNMFGETVAAQHAGHDYHRAAQGNRRDCYFTPDDRTMILAQETDLKFLMDSSTGKPSRHPWDDAWRQVEQGQITIAVGSNGLAQRLLPKLIRPGGPGGNQAQFDAFAPLWTRAHGYAIGFDMSKGLAFDLVAECGSDEGAEKVEQTVRALLTLAGNLMDQFRQKIGVAPREAVEPMQLLADTIDPLLAKARSEHKGRVARVQSATDLDLEAVVKVLLPAVQAARVAARRKQSVNNLKQLALAMHNYYSVNDKFPPAVLYGPDGKTPYSWRIALLPYLEQADLYNQYRFNEPWDGPNNRKLLDRMPAVFGHPDAVGSHKPAYFPLVGPDTMFGVEGGTGMAQISDGTSNTITFVEAKRDIPWTKPEDIPYDKEKPLPELGGFSPGGFNAVFADGAWRFIKSTINENVLRALFTRDGGEPVSRDAY